MLKQEWSRVQFSGEGTCQQLHHAYLYLVVSYSPYKPALFLAPSAIFCSNCFICSRHLENFFLELSNSVALWDLEQNWVLSCKLAARACNFKFCKNPKNYCTLGGPMPYSSAHRRMFLTRCWLKDGKSKTQQHPCVSRRSSRIWASMAWYKLFMIQNKASSHWVAPILGPRTPAIPPGQLKFDVLSHLNGG